MVEAVNEANANVLNISGPPLEASGTDPVAAKPEGPPLAEEGGQRVAAPEPEEEAPAPEKPSDTETETPAETEKVEAKPKQKGINERLSELTQKRKDAEARADQLERELTAERAKKTTPAEVPKFEEPKPKRESFDNPEAYDEALVKWTVRATQAEAEAKAAEKATKEANDRAVKEYTETLAKTWNESHAKVKEAHPDFDDVVMRDDIVIPAPTAQAIAETGSAEVAYHLAKNPEVLNRIAGMTPAKQIFELGKLAASLESKPELTRVSKPITTLRSSSAALPKSPDEESMAEYASRRLPQLQAERRGGGRPN